MRGRLKRLIASITILDRDFEVEYEFKITAPGHPATGPTYSCGGEPAQGPEFELEILGVRFAKQSADLPDLSIPIWLNDLLNTHLSERDDIYDEVLSAADDDRGPDPDYEYDRRRDEEGQP